jgi:glycosyltransferase involved in cell wall biosynthesis
MDSLKIVHVTHTYPPYMGGLSHMVDRVSRGLVERGHEVEVVTLDPSMSLEKNEDRGGVKVTRFPSFAPSNMYFIPSPTVISHLGSLEVDIVHAHCIGALLIPVCWLALRNRLEEITFVVSPHHHQSGSTWHARILWIPYYPLAKEVLRSADQVHCVSDYEASLVRKDFHIEPIVIPNGVDEALFKYKWDPPEGEMVLTYAGRLERYKRVHILIHAVHLLRRLGLQTSLRIIGEGPELDNLLRLSRRLEVELEYHNFLPRKDYLKLMSNSSSFVNPSMFEAYSIVVAEALAMGIPVIASEPWGKNFQDMGNTKIVNGGSPRDLAYAVREIKELEGGKNSEIPSWNHITETILQDIYHPNIH